MRWRLLDETKAVESPALGVAWDEALLRHAARPTLRLWVNRPCLVLGRFDARLPRLGRAVEALRAEGVTLVQRASGGTAVWHDETVLNVSAIVPAGDAPRGVHEAFEALGAGMVRGLDELGLEGSFSCVPGTYCDGPHNLAVAGRKVAGLSQVRKRHAVLVHASLLVHTDLGRMHDRLERFYALAGRAQRFDRARAATLALLCGASVADVRGAVVRGYRTTGAVLRCEEATPAERASARRGAVEIAYGPAARVRTGP